MYMLPVPPPCFPYHPQTIKVKISPVQSRLTLGGSVDQRSLKARLLSYSQHDYMARLMKHCYFSIEVVPIHFHLLTFKLLGKQELGQNVSSHRCRVLQS